MKKYKFKLEEDWLSVLIWEDEQWKLFEQYHRDRVENFDEMFPTPKGKRIISAGHYLRGDSENSVEKMLELIDNYDGDPTDLIDDIDGVVVWEPLCGSLTVERFLMEV